MTENSGMESVEESADCDAEVVARVDGGPEFTATRAEEAEMALAPYGRRDFAGQGGDRDGHRQVIANGEEQFGVVLSLVSLTGGGKSHGLFLVKSPSEVD